ncbi:uncharacterized protein LOC116342573 isoform X2 [Contarinia nasturtii]|uniref:uncharacterized protein LOC116342573 isoform X2 n=1 Tax=Contarinia nasturtii TaxID=265458 RepID=UPI0012D3E2F9|nr:uncharacterized protein LOC116342573 isoform X2 [Contarinia nasturtii]
MINKFLRELHSYINDVSVVDDETTRLLMEIVLAVDKLQTTSKYYKLSASNEKQSFHDLNEEIFKCHRRILCRVCEDNFSPEDFDTHVQKESHKVKETNFKSSQPIPNKNVSTPERSIEHKHDYNCTVTSAKRVELKHTGPVSSMSSNLQSAIKVNNCSSVTSDYKINIPTVFSMENLSRAIAEVDLAKPESLKLSTCKDVESLIKAKYAPNATVKMVKKETNNFAKMDHTISTHDAKLDEASTSCNGNQLNINLNPDMKIFDLIDKEITMLCQPLYMESRKRLEDDIFSTISKYIHQFDKSLEVLIFGSSYYEIKGAMTDLNLLINTHYDRPKEISQRFFLRLERTNIAKDFKQIHKVAADRVLRRQISMVHIKSGIKCFLLFENDNSIADSSKIIGRFVNAEPMCRFLITYIRTWQNMLNKSGLAKFEFNTYIISILVIFFLQMNHKLPRVGDMQSTDNSASKTSNIVSFRDIPQNFFSFYGNSYQMWNHVISAHIGRWQERRIQPEQKNFSEVQQRLRKGIETAPANWINCTMYMFDPM